jgi:hypothetical protein
MEGATDLADLLGSSSPVQNGQLPQSTTFSPIVTGGIDPFISPMGGGGSNTSGGGAGVSQQHAQTFGAVRYVVKNLMVYVGFFLAVLIVSLSTPRSVLLQYVPNTYSAGGVVSYTGAAILAGVAVAIAYLFSTLMNVVL